MNPVLTQLAGFTIPQFEGFTCSEGQQASSFKQFWITLLIVGLLSVLVAAIHRRWASKALLVSLIVVSVFIVLVAAIIGPFFYTDWGCDFILLELLTSLGN